LSEKNKQQLIQLKILFKSLLIIKNAQINSLKIIEDKSINIISPFSQKIISSNIAFYINHGHSFFYRFTEKLTFYLIFATFSYKKVAIYFPDVDLIIYLKKSNWNLIKTLNNFKTFIVCNHQESLAFLENKKQKKIMGLYDLSNHLAHNLANEIAGIQELKDTNQIDALEYYACKQFNIYGELTELYPEINKQKIIDISKATERDINSLAWQKNLLLVNIARNIYVKNELANRVYAVALQKCEPAHSQIIKLARQNCRIILWIGLRIGTRSWLSQKSGLEQIIRAISEQYLDLGIVFHGYGRFDEEVEELHLLTNDLIQSLSNKAQFFLDINTPMAQQILWAKNSDLYISAWGGELTLVNWIANKPGVVHTNKTVVDNFQNNSYGCHREDIVLPVIVSSLFDSEDKIVRNNVNDSRQHLAHYECDWQEIYRQAIEILQTLNK
jgi:hypothetical protein